MSLSAAHEAAVRRVTTPGYTGIELLSPPRGWPLPHPPAKRAHIAIFDSSFNPPTLAHLAIASTAFPQPEPSATSGVTDPGSYTARLLLYSARNADKTLKPGDANPAQRAALMHHQAAAMSAHTEATAVGVLSAATFVAKAGILRDTLRARLGAEADVALTFLVGTDTLVRIFDSKYYDPAAGGIDAALKELFAIAWLVCARRGDERDIEDTLLASPEVAPWVAAGKVRMMPAPDGVAHVSSTSVREAVRSGKGVEGLEGLCVPLVAEYVVQNGLYAE